MHPNFQTTAYPGDKGGADNSVITCALKGQSFLRAQHHRFVGRIMAAGIETFIANRWSLQYRTGTEFCSSMRSPSHLKRNHSHTPDSMSTMWSLR